MAEEKKKKKRANGHFCGWDYSAERKVRQTLRVASQYTSIYLELICVKSFGCFKFHECAPIPFVQATVVPSL